jgi:hypothetical protein
VVGLGTAACALALFGGYAAYSLVRVSAAAEVPALAPVRPSIPPPPEISVAQTLATPPDAAIVDPPKAVPVPQVKPKPIRRLAAQVAEAPPPVREFFHIPDPPPAPRFAALPAAPALPRPVLNDSVATAILPPDPPEAPDPPSVEALPEKKSGNRLFRVLHKVVPFHRASNAVIVDDPNTPAQEPH